MKQKRSDTELFALNPEPEKSKRSRIDTIGQNGNDGLHYKPKGYAIQSIFSYGWDFVGFDDEDGLREVFKTKKAAKQELDEILEFTGDTPDDWRIIPYNPHEDETFARF